MNAHARVMAVTVAPRAQPMHFGAHPIATTAPICNPAHRTEPLEKSW